MRQSEPDDCIMSERISVGIACYQAADTVERAVHSALAQDWPDLEVIVVDDASDDGGPALVEAIARGDPRVRLIRHRENRGPGAARQTILEAATGEFIAFFDDDDISVPERVRRQHERLLAYEADIETSKVICYASGKRAYPNGYELDLPAIGSEPLVPIGDAVADYLLFNGRRANVFYGSGTPTCALFARTRTLREAGGFDPQQRRVEDADLAIRLARQGGHFIGCRQRLFRQYATQAGDKSAAMNHAAELRIIEKNRDYLEAKGRYGYARAWCHVRYHHFRGARGAMVASLLGVWIRHPWVVTRHLLRSAGRRWRHERRMAASGRL